MNVINNFIIRILKLFSGSLYLKNVQSFNEHFLHHKNNSKQL